MVSTVATGVLDLTAASPLVGDTPQVQAWVRAAQAGDRAAFDALVSLYYRAVYRTAMAALQRTEDAEDATQDAFVLAWRKVSGFRGDASFKTWLLTIVWRQALDRRTRRDRWWRRQAARDLPVRRCGVGPQGDRVDYGAGAEVLRLAR